MSLRVAIQMDPIEGIDIDADSTFALGIEAEARGHELFFYLPQDLSLRDGLVQARGRSMSLRRESGNHVTFGAEEVIDLSSVDVVLMRQDPPFDMAYITATHILEHIHPETLVVNDPASVRNAPEKLFVTHFEGLLPPTLITSDEKEIVSFRETHKDIILKPLYGNGGAGVFRLKPDDSNFKSLLEMFSENFREPIIAQAFVPEVKNGDKRIILVDGEPAGAINRVPAEGETRSNLHVGGKAEAVDLSKRDKEICARIGPALKAQGLIFVGIDVIGNYLTEINVTSPTGIQEIKHFGGHDISAMIWDVIEKKKILS